MSDAYEIPDDAEMEIVHNPLNLPHKKLLKLRQSTSKLVEHVLENWLSSKHESYRLRYVFDHTFETLELGERRPDNIRAAMRVISRYVDDVLSWRSNALLKKQREFKYKRTLIT